MCGLTLHLLPRESQSDDTRHGSGALCGGRRLCFRTVLRCHSDIACSAARPKSFDTGHVRQLPSGSQSVVETTAPSRGSMGHSLMSSARSACADALKSVPTSNNGYFACADAIYRVPTSNNGYFACADAIYRVPTSNNGCFACADALKSVPTCGRVVGAPGGLRAAGGCV